MVIEEGIFIPQDIWEIDNLSFMDKAFLSELKRLDNGNGVKVTNAELAIKFKVTRERCSGIVNDLKKKGYIKTSYDNVNRRTIKIKE